MKEERVKKEKPDHLNVTGHRSTDKTHNTMMAVHRTTNL